MEASSGTFPLSQPTRRRLGQLGDEFLAEILGAETRRHPDNLEALVDLAMILTQLGRYREGLEADRKLVELCPLDPTVRYNLACSLALLERVDESFEALEAALELGYADGEYLAQDEDLASLRQDPRFSELCRRLKRTT